MRTVATEALSITLGLYDYLQVSVGLGLRLGLGSLGLSDFMAPVNVITSIEVYTVVKVSVGDRNRSAS